MKIDATTPPDALADALAGTHDSFKIWQAARAELARRSELADRYMWLTQALSILSASGGSVYYGDTEIIFVRHGESAPTQNIADVIIKAAGDEVTR